VNGLAALSNRLGPLIGLAVVVGLFCLDGDVRPYFLSTRNLILVCSQTAVVAMAARGLTMIIVSGGIDLSVGSVVALTSVVCAAMLASGAGEASAIVAALTVGVAIGLVNGFLIGGLGLVPFIVTLGMMGVARGLSKWLADNQTVNPPENGVTGLMSTLSADGGLTLPGGVWLVVALAALMWVAMHRSVFGRHLYAIGSNEATARLCGVRVPLVKISVYALAGLAFGLAGVMQFARLTQGDPTVAIGLELDVIAAVVLGGASLSGGTGSIAGAIIGALIMAVLRNGANQMGWPNFVQEIIIGAVIVLAIGVDRLRQRSVQGVA
jgi:ribose transport system permease protein